MSKPVEPTYNYLSTVTVTDDNYIEVQQLTDPNATIQYYRLERAIFPANDFEEIAQVRALDFHVAGHAAGQLDEFVIQHRVGDDHVHPPICVDVRGFETRQCLRLHVRCG